MIGGGVALDGGVVVLLSVFPRNRDRLEKEKLELGICVLDSVPAPLWSSFTTLPP